MSDLFEPIAVVGVAARLPGARDVDEYWRNLVEGRECITPLTDAELLAAGVSRKRLADPSYVKRAGLVPDLDMFDPEFFHMTPREAEVCDPQQRLFLEVTYEAIENAGYHPGGLGREVAVYGASGPAQYGDLHVLANPKYTADSELFGLSTLNNTDFLATLASYKLDFRGPSMAVLTACSSSLATVLMACRSLQLGDCDAAVAAATHAVMPYRVGYRWSPGDVRSPDGHCRPFDAAATGTVFTSGAGAVLLRRLSDATADGDHIWAVIHGIGTNNDGSNKVSFSAPSLVGVADVIVDGMAMAGLGSAEIDCVEMHATGTPIGDPIEVKALAQAYRRLGGTVPDGSIPVGSVKSNIGHAAAVAGMAGLLKLVLALEHEQLPPTINVTRANPKLEIEGTPLAINDTLRPWPRTGTRPRRAGLTSLGIGGTNFHLVLEEGPVPARTPHQDRPRVVVWSGRNAAARDANQAALTGYFSHAGEDAFADAVATLQRGRAAHRVRAAAVCTSGQDAARSLAAGGRVLTGQVSGEDPPGLVFAFPGQGAQHARMASGVYGRHRVFTETVDTCLDAIDGEGLECYSLWLAETPGDDLYETANAQPLLFAVEYALAQQWIDWGIRPSGLIGHSVGELVAAAVAGVMDLADALRLVVLRGQAMQRRPRGAMLVAATGPGSLPSLLPAESGVTVAAVNATEQVVLAGAARDVTAAGQALAAAGVATQPLRTSHAFHSPAMRPAVEEFRAGFAGVRLRPPAVPLYSAGTGQRLTDAQAVDPDFWARQLADPVRFADAVDAMTAGAEGQIVLEVGPGRTLSGLLQRHPAVTGRWRSLASLPRPGSHPDPRADERTLLDTLAELWLSGCPVDWTRVYPDETPQRVPLPGYQFQRQRYWVEAVTGPAAPQPDTEPDAGVEAEARTGAAPAGPEQAPAGDAQTGPFTVPGWVEAPLPAAGDPAPAGTALALLPAGGAEALRYVNALQQAGHSVVRVRPGGEPAERAGEFVVRPGQLAGDLEWVLGRLAAGGGLPSTLVHAWGAGVPDPGGSAAGTVDGELDRTIFALLDLVQTAARRPVGGRLPALLVLTSGAVDVSGGEPVAPARAALVAAARTYGLESPGTVCRVIDAGPVCAEDLLVAELASGVTDRVVALRGTRRWLPTQRPWSPAAGRPMIRRDGVYVLTGGLGGLGLAVAKGLAATGRRPRLALLARHPREAAEDLAEIESMGAEVRAITCDVADPRQLGTALDQVAEAFGPVNGVLHLAGVAGGGMLQLRGRDDAERVLRPKVHGTLALAGALAGRPPADFVVCFSSRAAVAGMVGSGDYAAANAFMDAFASGRTGWLSVNWPAWTTVGMAAAGGLGELEAALRAVTSPDGDGAGGGPAGPGPCHETVLSAATHWELDEHRVGDAAVLPGTGIVNLILRALPEQLPDATGPVTLRDVMFLRPLVADSPHRVRVCFAPAGAQAWRVRVLSRPDGRAGGWQEHTRCELTVGGPAAPAVPVDELAAGLPEVPPPSMLPEPGQAIVFGPRWRCVERLWESDQVTAAELAVPAPFADEAGDYPVHPALMDIGTGLLRRRAPADLLVPFLYERMTWYAPMPARVHCRLRRRPGEDLIADVEFVATDGTVVTTVEGFRLRPPQPAELTAAGTRPDGLAPAEGVRLLLRLIETGTPAQVGVLPHRHGRPVPPAAPAAPVAPPPPAPPPPPGQVPVEPAPVAPNGAATGSVQDRLAALWQQVLGRPQVCPEDDFFALGGDSLVGVALVGRIRDAFAVEMSIGSLFESPTLGELTAVLVGQGAR